MKNKKNCFLSLLSIVMCCVSVGLMAMDKKQKQEVIETFIKHAAEGNVRGLSSDFASWKLGGHNPGALINGIDDLMGRTALHAAGSDNTGASAGWLIVQGANTGIVDWADQKAAYYAQENKNSIVTTLLRVQDEKHSIADQTPLHRLVYDKNEATGIEDENMALRCAHALLAGGACCDVVNGSGDTPSSAAQKARMERLACLTEPSLHKMTAQWLIDKGVNLGDLPGVVRGWITSIKSA